MPPIPDFSLDRARPTAGDSRKYSDVPVPGQKSATQKLPESTPIGEPMKRAHPYSAAQVVSPLINHDHPWHVDYLKTTIQFHLEQPDHLNASMQARQRGRARRSHPICGKVISEREHCGARWRLTRVSHNMLNSFQLDYNLYTTGDHFPFHILSGRSGRPRVSPVPVPLPSPQLGTKVAERLERANRPLVFLRSPLHHFKSFLTASGTTVCNAGRCADACAHARRNRS